MAATFIQLPYPGGARGAAFLVAVLALLGCQDRTAQQQTRPADTMAMQTSWRGVAPCSGGAVRMVDNAEFRLTNVPADTRTLRFHLFHTNAGVEHGTHAMPYTGQAAIAAGTFKYMGPCPRSTGYYTWTVEALDGSGAVLGRGSQALTYEPNQPAP